MPHTVSFGLAVSIVAILIFVVLLVLYRRLVRIPVLRGVLTVPGEPLPTAETAEDSAAVLPGDIGYETPDVDPVPPDAPDPKDARAHGKKPDKKSPPRSRAHPPDSVSFPETMPKRKDSVACFTT